MSDAAVLSVPRAVLSRAQAGSWMLTASVLAVAAVSPFERAIPGLSAAGLDVSTLEAAVAVAAIVFAFAALAGHVPVIWRSPITWPVVALLGWAAISTAIAPEFQANAIKATGRLAAMALVFVLTMSVLSSTVFVRRLLLTLLAVGSIVGVIAVLELAQLPIVIDALRSFRPGVHVVGGQVRAMSTLFYPTIASMYLEVVFALSLALLVQRTSWLVLAGLAAVGAGIIATFTRAGLISMALSIAVVGALHYVRSRSWTRAHWMLTALGATLIAFVFVSHTPEVLLIRFGTDTSQDWYGATYKAPAQRTFRPGGVYQVPVAVKNTGMMTWQSANAPVFFLSYHWLDAATEDVVQFDGARTPFERPVRSGDEAIVNATVRVPGYPGRYVLVWDVVHEHVAWLSTEGVESARTEVSVAGAAVSAPLKSVGRLPGASVRMPRLTLWSAAARVAAAHPIAGVGPDNYRHVYGRYLQLATWDSRVHANNVYLETLAGIGAPGLIALGWLLIAGAIALRRQWRESSMASAPLVAALIAAWLSIAGHGLVDSFLMFTPTYVLFALTAGLTFSHAHRV